MSDFCQELQTILRDITGYHHTSVRSIGCTLFITLQATPQVILDAVFAPFLQYKPRWEVKSHGWHHIFFTHQGLSTLQYNYNAKDKSPKVVDQKPPRTLRSRGSQRTRYSDVDK